MAAKKIFLVIFLLYLSRVESASYLERSYEYVMSLGKSVAPSFMTFLDCFMEKDAWGCAKEKASRILDKWDDDVKTQRRMWQEAADAEVKTSGRAIDQLPSKLGTEVEASLTTLSNMVQNGMARAMSRHKHEDEGQQINLAISSSGGKKKKKKTKPPKIHLIHMKEQKDQKGEDRGFSSKAQTWSIGEKHNATNARKGRGILGDLWELSQKGLDGVAEHVQEKEDLENGIETKEAGEMRGKKKKKKKAILKLLILGAVLKAKIGTLLQILSFKLQVKFFLIALVGLGINLARFWLDLKKQHQPPQKVIYYEHAQHQHHYDHEEESGGGGWGPWSRSLDPEHQETDDAEIDFDANPYRAQLDRSSQAYSRPVIAHAMKARS